MRPRSTLLIHSTVAPETCVRLAESAAAHGVDVLDAPVSGSGEAARARKLLLLVGGDVDALRRVSQVLASYADPVIHVGAVGDGQRAKIVNNLARIGNMAVAEAALRLSASAGLDRGVLRKALLSGSGRGFALDVLDRRVVPSSAGHVAALFGKDLALAEALSRSCGANIGGTVTLALEFVAGLLE